MLLVFLYLVSPSIIPSKFTHVVQKISFRFLKKLELELPYDPAMPLLGIYPEKLKTLIWKNICTDWILNSKKTLWLPYMQCWGNSSVSFVL